MGIRRNHLYTLGMPHSNCGGGCIKAGIKHFLHLLKVLPETFARWESEEQKMRDFLERDVSILKDRRGMKPGDKPKPLTLRQVRERQEELDADKEIEFDWGGLWLLQRPTANAAPCFASGGVK